MASRFRQFVMMLGSRQISRLSPVLPFHAPHVGGTKTRTFFLRLALSVLPYPYCSVLDQGVWAEVKVADEHLRLFAEHNALGVQASVYNVIAKTWIAPSEPVDDLEQWKEQAAAHAQQYLKRVGNLELPPLRWKESRSA
jgi:hypothetical protein